MSGKSATISFEELASGHYTTLRNFGYGEIKDEDDSGGCSWWPMQHISHVDDLSERVNFLDPFAIINRWGTRLINELIAQETCGYKRATAATEPKRPRKMTLRQNEPVEERARKRREQLARIIAYHKKEGL